MTLNLLGYLIHFTKDTRLDDLVAKVDQLLSAKQADVNTLTARVASVTEALTHATEQENS